MGGLPSDQVVPAFELPLATELMSGGGPIEGVVRTRLSIERPSSLKLVSCVSAQRSQISAPGFQVRPKTLAVRETFPVVLPSTATLFPANTGPVKLSWGTLVKVPVVFQLALVAEVL